MIIQYSDNNENRIKWQHRRGGEWKTAELDALIEAYEREKTGKWIPVSERLPDEEKGTYWVCTDTEHQCECRWTNVNHIWTGLTTNWHWHIMDIPQYTKVIAWMPLPEPYNCGARMVEE